jgi:hypothetical protein
MGHALPPSASNQPVITSFIIAVNGGIHKKKSLDFSAKESNTEALYGASAGPPRGRTLIA